MFRYHLSRKDTVILSVSLGLTLTWGIGQGVGLGVTEGRRAIIINHYHPPTVTLHSVFIQSSEEKAKRNYGLGTNA